MKQCFKCKVNKPKKEFYKSKITKSKLSSYCKTCYNIITKKWQKENKELYYATRKKKYNERKRFLTDYKKKLKCQICREGDPACLVFHHRNPKEKDFYIACSIWGHSVETLMDEIDKCDVLCANCHAKLHYHLKKKWVDIMKFKIGDKVKLLPEVTSCGVESEEVGKVGIIKTISGDACKYYGFMVQMREVCKVRGCIPTWSVGGRMIELTPKKNEQLLFNFMGE